jgi:hypothetical protein
MDGLIGQSDGLIRFGIFASVFVLMALIELGWPKRRLIVSKRRRWFTNIGISVAAPLCSGSAMRPCRSRPSPPRSMRKQHHRPPEPSLLA